MCQGVQTLQRVPTDRLPPEWEPAFTSFLDLLERAAAGGVHEREIARRELAVVRFVPARVEPAVCPDAGSHAAQEGIELCAAYRDLPRHRPHHLQQERIQSDLCTARIREVEEGEEEEEEEEEKEKEKETEEEKEKGKEKEE